MSDNPQQVSILRELHRSLDERWRPEDVAQPLLSVLDLNRDERRLLERANDARRQSFWSSMSKDFKRPSDMSRQLKVAEKLFGRIVGFAPDDLEQIEQWVRQVEGGIGKTFGRNDFKYDRLPKEKRSEAGIELSRRQYNKRFRLVVRLEKKMRRIVRERFKRSLALASKTRLASQIGWEDFSSDLNSACFIAYYVARCNLRSLFTNTSQVRPYDEICEMLMQRCKRAGTHANWWAIAHVLPTSEVLCHLDDEQKGVLLAGYFDMLHSAASFLRELWESNQFNEDMVVSKGNDSTTWNLTAGAWNKLRDGWFSLNYSLGISEAVDRVCPGKV